MPGSVRVTVPTPGGLKLLRQALASTNESNRYRSRPLLRGRKRGVPGATCGAVVSTAVDQSGRINIAICLFADAEELDWAGPWEVLGTWSVLHPDEVHVFTVAEHADVVRCAKGLRVLPDYRWAEAPQIDVLVYPGGDGTDQQRRNPRSTQWIQELATRGVLMTSVCTGSLVFAEAGLLDGHSATTHWTAVDELAKLGRDIEVEEQARFVDEGWVITAAGVSAGIDMALHLIARLHSRERAVEVRRDIQYDPAPPV